MKISMMSYSLARGEWGKNPDLYELCDLARELELDGIDWVTVYNFAPEEVAKVTRGYGLNNICYTFFAPLQHADSNKRSQIRTTVEQGLEIASILGSDKVMFPLSGVEGQSRELTQKLALEGLAEIMPLAASYEISVTVEHFHGTSAPFITSEDMQKAVATIPELKITYDNGNVYTAGEDPAQAFLKVKDHIIHAHFKDWEVATEGNVLGFNGHTYKPALIGEGKVAPLPCLQAMKSAGYTGYINMEYEGNDYEAKDAIRRGTKYLQELIAELT